MSAKRKWIPIVIGVAILVVFVGIGAILFSASYIREHLQVTTSSEADAMREFDEVHAKFPGPALLEMRDGERIGYSEGRETEPASSTQLTTLHIVAWDPREDHLAKFDLPFWLLRLKSGPISFGSYAAGFDDTRVRIRPEEIEKHGPGIVIDVTDRRGPRALIWVE